MSKKSSVDQDEKWVQAQRKAFTHWVNSCLRAREEKVETLEEGFNNGLRLISLVEILTKESLRKRPNKTAALRVHKVNNCFLALEHIQDPQIGNFKGLTVGAEDFVDGRTKMILGFCWQLLRKFSDLGAKGDGSGAGSGSFESGLLDWVKTKLGSYDLDFDKGFKSSAFTSGKAFLALNNEFDSSLLDYKSYDASNALVNCQDALRIAEDGAGVPSTIDPEDLASGNASDKEIVLYLTLWYETFKAKQGNVSTDSLQLKLKAVEEEIIIVSNENEELRLKLQQGESQTLTLNGNLSTLTEEREQLTIKLKDEFETKLKTMQEEFAESKLLTEQEISKLKESVQMDGKSSEEKMQSLQQNIHQTNGERDKLQEELKAYKDNMEKEKEDLAKENAKLERNIKQFEKEHSELEALLRKQQAEQGRSVFLIRKEMMRHISCMNEWKIFLNQEGMKYVSDDLAHTMEVSAEYEKMSTAEKETTVAQTLSDEDAQLVELTKQRNKEDQEKKDGTAKPKSAVKATSSGGAGGGKRSARKKEGK